MAKKPTTSQLSQARVRTTAKAMPNAAAKSLKTQRLKKQPPSPLPTGLHRERRRLPEAESDNFEHLGDARLLSSARAGHDELRAELKQHTEGGPELTAGDLDARWQDAYALGDESPGGDNMTPDQGRVDDIGRALGIVYEDGQELRGGDEIAARDAHRWELDPASRNRDEDE